MDGRRRQSGEIHQKARDKGMNISAVILTLNEERNIVDCIRTLKTWCDDVIVYDSYSTDKTVELAEAEGARVYKRRFDNYANQRNAALREVEYPGEWVLMADADERWDREVGSDIAARISDPENRDVDIIHYRRKDMFMGRWLKHNIGTGTWFGRVLRLGHVEVHRAINEEYECSGKKIYAGNIRFVHYPFSNGMNWWIARHNRYSDMEAVRLLEEHKEKLVFSSLFSKDPALRRKTQKQLLYRLPLRPLSMFFALYIVKLGFLDGAAGFHYSVLRSFYEYMIDLKMLERKIRTKGNSF